jgi:hypothetical protein
MELEIKVTHINNRYHVRLYHGTDILDEMACVDQRDIGYICREMLRWYAKLGGNSAHASAARHRQTQAPCGRIWLRRELELEK